MDSEIKIAAMETEVRSDHQWQGYLMKDFFLYQKEKLKGKKKEIDNTQLHFDLLWLIF